MSKQDEINLANKVWLQNLEKQTGWRADQIQLLINKKKLKFLEHPSIRKYLRLSAWLEEKEDSDQYGNFGIG